MFAEALTEIALAVEHVGKRGGSPGMARAALNRCERLLRELEERIDSHPALDINAAVGLAALVLPARKAAAALSA